MEILLILSGVVSHIAALMDCFGLVAVTFDLTPETKVVDEKLGKDATSLCTIKQTISVKFIYVNNVR